MALQDLLAGLPEVGGHEEDPLVTGLAKQAELQRMRSEASQARWAECQDHKLWLAEKNWRKQVRKTKEDERRRKAEEAARAEAERRAEEERKRRAKIPELSPAEKAEAEAKAARAKLLMEAKNRWLSEEWQPMFQQRKQEVQAQRLDAEERVRREKAAEEDRKNYECGGMEAEDVRVRQREAFLSAECERLAKRAQTPRVQEAIEKKIELVLEMRGLEIRWKQNLEKRRLEEQQALLALQEERKERDYREWRSEVQEERLRRRRLIAREEAQEKELLEWKTLELLGRDVLREEELKKKAAVEAAFQKSSVQRRQLEEQGILPSRVLQEAKVLAEEQRKTMEQVGPKQAEQELWDALMAKNRWARTQQMGSTHPTSREVSWARGLVGPWLLEFFAPTTFFRKAMVFGLTIWASCIISSPCNEWRGFTLQPKEKKLPFSEYFKPINYARSTGIGSAIMGIALMIGMLVTPYAEESFGYLKEHTAVALGIVAVVVIGIVALSK